MVRVRYLSLTKVHHEFLQIGSKNFKKHQYNDYLVILLLFDYLNYRSKAQNGFKALTTKMCKSKEDKILSKDIFILWTPLGYQTVSALDSFNKDDFLLKA